VWLGIVIGNTTASIITYTWGRLTIKNYTLRMLSILTLSVKIEAYTIGTNLTCPNDSSVIF